MNDAQKRRNAVFAECTRSLSGHRPRKVKAWLEEMAQSVHALAPADEYGEGALVRALETQVAAQLGKEDAVFCAKGVIAQQAALRVWCERAGSRNVIVHPKSHIDIDEGGAYERLHQLTPLRVGGDQAQFTLAQLEKTRERAGVLTIEVPLRRAGYRVLPWEDLQAIAAWAKGRGMALHLDGARLWECGPYYGRSYAEIAGVADSVYVSFYKGLGGVAGCVLAGSGDFIAEARVWIGRHGGNLVTSFPMVISALDGLERHLPKMAGYHARAVEIAGALSALPGLRVAPSPPTTNSFQLYLPGTIPAWEAATLELAERERVSLLRRFAATQFDDVVMSEVVIGEAAEDWETEEIVAQVKALCARALA